MEVTVVTRQQAMRGRWTASRCAARPVDLLGSGVQDSSRRISL